MNYPLFVLIFFYTYSCLQRGKNKYHLQEAGLHFLFII